MIWGFSPIVGIIIGVGVFLLFRVVFRFKLERRHFLLMVVCSLILSLVLTFEESTFGIIYHQYDKHIAMSNEAESSKAVHEIELGSGKVLYFSSQYQDNFELNFEYQGTSNITKTQIVDLAESYCLQHNYEIENIGKISLFAASYVKSDLVIAKHPDEVDVDVKIKNGPTDSDHWGYQLTGFYLGLKYVDNQLQLVETGAYSWSSP